MALPSLALGTALAFARRDLEQLRPGSARYVGGRAISAFVFPGVLSTVGLFTYYFALAYGGVSLTIPTQQSYIVWGALAGWLYLGERFSSRAVLGILTVVAGLFALAFGQTQGIPISEQWYLAIPLALFTAMSYGISGVLWRKGLLLGVEQTTGVFVHFLATVATAGAGVLAFGRLDTLLGLSGRDVGLLLVSGVLSGIVGTFGALAAIARIGVVRTYVITALTPLVAVLLARFVLGERVTAMMAVGIVVVSLGVVLVQLFKPSSEAAG
jgi:drug/metabolite transporter (DMT)-like permease